MLDIQMIIIDNFGKNVDVNSLEVEEQHLANTYILENDVVLELGARFGSVSCIINSKLNNKNNHVAVEPDDRVWNALETNKVTNSCQFNIVKGFIARKKLGLTNLQCHYGGYGSTSFENNESNIPSYTLEEISDTYKLNFNVLVADCEGYLEVFLDENPSLYDSLRMIIFEADYAYKCNYQKIRAILTEKNFNEILGGFQNVWIKS